MAEVAVTPETLDLHELLAARRDEFQLLLDRYGATNPRLFGRDDIDVFAARLLKRPISDSALADAVEL